MNDISAQKKLESPLRILVVDNNKNDIDAIKNALEKSGIPYKITQCSNVTDALGYLHKKNFAFDVAISDYELPDRSGLELFQELRDSGSQIPFTLLNKTASKDIEEEAFKNRVDEYMVKDNEQNYLKLLPLRIYQLGQQHIKQIIEPGCGEEELKNHHEHLEELVKERAGELKISNKRIEHLNPLLHSIRNINQLITQVKDRDKLIEGACKQLIENRGYFNSWISVFDEEGRFKKVAGAGMGKEFSSLKKMLKDGKMVKCQKMALKKDGVITIEDASKKCKGCPQASKHKETDCLVTRLMHEKKIYGTMTVSLPKDLATNQEEQMLFKELAGDISFALHSIGIEEERKRTEKALMASETRYRRLFETAKDGILLLDADTGQITDVNPFLIGMLGYTHQELFGKQLWEFGLFKDIASSKAAFKELQNREYIRYEDLPLETKDGKRIEVEFVSNVYQVDGKKVIQCNIRDITERKRAEEELLLKNIVFESSIGANSTMDNNGLINHVNPAFLKMWGYKIKDEIKNNNMADLFVNPEDAASFFETLNKTGKWEGEFLAKRKDGSRFISHGLASVIRNKKGEQIGYQSANLDITAQKNAEIARKQLTIELAQKNKELEQIVYVTSHDLRSPLVNIQGFSKELEESLKDLEGLLDKNNIPTEIKEKIAITLREDVPESLQYIFSSITKMDSLLSGLLVISRLGKAELKFEKLHMNRLITDITKTLEFQIKNADVDIEISELPPCMGDETQINQVFSNLLGNAIKYLDPKQPGIIKISGYEDKGQVIYCVEDNGIGIAPEHQDKIFDIFHRLNPEIATGEGLGLTIIRKILEKHDGKISVESELGKGSKFYISLPTLPTA